MKAEADKLRARAAAGEDFAKLQQEAYDFAGYTQIKGGDPRVNQVRKAAVPPADASIFDLKIRARCRRYSTTPRNFVVYKIEAVEAVAGGRRSRRDIPPSWRWTGEPRPWQSMQKSTKLNDAYFAPPSSGGAADC